MPMSATPYPSKLSRNFRRDDSSGSSSKKTAKKNPIDFDFSSDSDDDDSELPQMINEAIKKSLSDRKRKKKKLGNPESSFFNENRSNSTDEDDDIADENIGPKVRKRPTKRKWSTPAARGFQFPNSNEDPKRPTKKIRKDQEKVTKRSGYPADADPTPTKKFRKGQKVQKQSATTCSKLFFNNPENPAKKREVKQIPNSPEQVPEEEVGEVPEKVAAVLEEIAAVPEQVAAVPEEVVAAPERKPENPRANKNKKVETPKKTSKEQVQKKVVVAPERKPENPKANKNKKAETVSERKPENSRDKNNKKAETINKMKEVAAANPERKPEISRAKNKKAETPKKTSKEHQQHSVTCQNISKDSDPRDGNVVVAAAEKADFLKPALKNLAIPPKVQPVMDEKKKTAGKSPLMGIKKPAVVVAAKPRYKFFKSKQELERIRAAEKKAEMQKASEKPRSTALFDITNDSVEKINHKQGLERIRAASAAKKAEMQKASEKPRSTALFDITNDSVEKTIKPVVERNLRNRKTRPCYAEIGNEDDEEMGELDKQGWRKIPINMETSFSEMEGDYLASSQKENPMIASSKYFDPIVAKKTLKTYGRKIDKRNDNFNSNQPDESGDASSTSIVVELGKKKKEALKSNKSNEEQANKKNNNKSLEVMEVLRDMDKRQFEDLQLSPMKTGYNEEKLDSLLDAAAPEAESTRFDDFNKGDVTPEKQSGLPETPRTRHHVTPVRSFLNKTRKNNSSGVEIPGNTESRDAITMTDGLVDSNSNKFYVKEVSKKKNNETRDASTMTEKFIQDNNNTMNLNRAAEILVQSEAINVFREKQRFHELCAMQAKKLADQIEGKF